MKETRLSIDKKINAVENESKLSFLWRQFFLHPIVAGISGFTIFFLFSILLDFIANIFNPDKFLTIDIFTVLIGIAGFLLAFGFTFLESTQKK